VGNFVTDNCRKARLGFCVGQNALINYYLAAWKTKCVRNILINKPDIPFKTRLVSFISYLTYSVSYALNRFVKRLVFRNWFTLKNLAVCLGADRIKLLVGNKI